MNNLREGVIKDEATGELYLQATQRPDGTWRKPIKVKEGYMPQDEIPIYENKGMKWLSSKPTLPIGIDPQVIGQSKDPINENLSSHMTKNQKKNIKRKQKKHESNNVKHLPINAYEPQISNEKCISYSVEKLKLIETETNLDDKHDTHLKKIRTIRKKLKEIIELEKNQLNGLQLNDEQLVKLTRKSDLEMQLQMFL